jgi:LCP family protein required for cell wall assembly
MTTIEIPQAPPAPQPPRKKRTGRKILLWLLLLAVIAVFAVIGFLVWTDSKIDKIPASELASLQTVEGGIRNILIVGTDSRENLPDDFEGSFGNFAGSRTDVVMVAHFTGGRAQLLSLPRDLKVDIPGHGTNKINAAFVLGGPDLLVQTVQNNFGISINNYVEIDFVGFANVVNALGGVSMTFDNAARDVKSGLDVPAGTQTLNGEQALAFARSRSYQELQGGSWVSVDGNDIGRTGRQQELLLTMFDQASSPGKALNLPAFTSTFADQIRADEGLSVPVMIELGGAVLGLNSGDIDAKTLPVRVSNEGGVSYVVPVEPDATVTVDEFNAGQPFS